MRSQRRPDAKTSDTSDPTARASETDPTSAPGNYSRRDGLKAASIAAVATSMTTSDSAASADLPTSDSPTSNSDSSAESRTDIIAFSSHPDRIFLDGRVWANPMEDWQIRDGRAVCSAGGGNRNVHSLVHQIDGPSFRTAVKVRRVEVRKTDQVGFRLGIRADIDDHRAAAFAPGGLNAGIRDDKLFIANRTIDAPIDRSKPLTLELSGRPLDDDANKVRLTLDAVDVNGERLAQVQTVVATDRIVGQAALMHGFEYKTGGTSVFEFGDWTIAGDSVSHHPDRTFGPLLWTMYTVDRDPETGKHTLRLQTLLAPVGTEDNRDVTLRIGDKTLTQTIDEHSWTAIFEIQGYDASQPRDYRVEYVERLNDAAPLTHTRDGIVRADPTGRTLRLAAMTCQNDYAFPYKPVADNIAASEPDLLYFSGDQLYEGHGGFGVVRKPADRAIVNYLRKFYQFGWAFGDVMAVTPTVCIPDDHDVFQGNIWGEGGKPMDTTQGTSSNGGYIQPPSMVNVVHRTCAGHHPPPADPRPCEQDISVYYGTLLYGDTSFAILGDRQFKSGPEKVDTGPGRADHVTEADFDTSHLDADGLELLGSRQEQFLKSWAEDWRGHALKVVLSQTVFAAVATHHGGYDGYLKCDLDSGGWPQTPRNRACQLLKSAKALHINGDQHLATISQYGIDQQRDGSWSFCVPAIGAGYPRWWRPDDVAMPHQNRPGHDMPHTGEYIDGFGNAVYVYAHANPEVGRKKNRYELAHQKASGFATVDIDPDAKTYRLTAYRFLIDLAAGRDEDIFDGWPIVIAQSENAGQRRSHRPGETQPGQVESA